MPKKAIKIIVEIIFLTIKIPTIKMIMAIAIEINFACKFITLIDSRN